MMAWSAHGSGDSSSRPSAIAVASSSGRSPMQHGIDPDDWRFRPNRRFPKWREPHAGRSRNAMRTGAPAAFSPSRAEASSGAQRGSRCSMSKASPQGGIGNQRSLGTDRRIRATRHGDYRRTSHPAVEQRFPQRRAGELAIERVERGMHRAQVEDRGISAGRDGRAGDRSMGLQIARRSGSDRCGRSSESPRSTASARTLRGVSTSPMPWSMTAMASSENRSGSTPATSLSGKRPSSACEHRASVAAAARKLRIPGIAGDASADAVGIERFQSRADISVAIERRGDADIARAATTDRIHQREELDVVVSGQLGAGVGGVGIDGNHFGVGRGCRAGRR